VSKEPTLKQMIFVYLIGGSILLAFGSFIFPSTSNNTKIVKLFNKGCAAVILKSNNRSIKIEKNPRLPHFYASFKIIHQENTKQRNFNITINNIKKYNHPNNENSFSNEEDFFNKIDSYYSSNQFTKGSNSKRVFFKLIEEDRYTYIRCGEGSNKCKMNLQFKNTNYNYVIITSADHASDWRSFYQFTLNFSKNVSPLVGCWRYLSWR
jgi:hypothetical protein